jgi:hypothetical protein
LPVDGLGNDLLNRGVAADAVNRTHGRTPVIWPPNRLATPSPKPAALSHPALTHKLSTEKLAHLEDRKQILNFS